MSQDELSLALTATRRSTSTASAGWSMEQNRPSVRINVSRSKSMNTNPNRHFLKIDKDVELPPKRGFWKEQAHRMDFGDSVEFSCRKEAESLRQSLRQCKNTLTAIRYMGKNTWRVWKVERSSSDT